MGGVPPGSAGPRWAKRRLEERARFLLSVEGSHAMLRITEQPHPTHAAGATDRRAIVLEGRLVGPWVEELRRVVGGAESGGVILDLGALSFADGDGLTLLRSLRDSGVELASPSPFMAALIGVGADGDDNGDRLVG